MRALCAVLATTLALAAGAALAVTLTAPTAAAFPVDTGSLAQGPGLDPLLGYAYSLAEAQAHREGVPLSVTSGYRTAAEQDALWRQAIATHGGEAQARKWALPPGESTHVTGDALDVGPREGAAWLEANGWRWGLCRTYANEWWHFELVTFPGTPCPAMLPDASWR